MSGETERAGPGGAGGGGGDQPLDDEPRKMEPELLRALARAEADLARESRSVLLEQHTHLFRWLTASLLALNGGAIVALLNTDAILNYDKIVPGRLFAAGIVAALLIGVFNQRALGSAVRICQEQMGFWIAVEYFGERDEDREAKFSARIRRSMILSRVGQVLGWASALLLVGGLATASDRLIINTSVTGPTSDSPLVAPKTKQDDR